MLNKFPFLWYASWRRVKIAYVLLNCHSSTQIHNCRSAGAPCRIDRPAILMGGRRSVMFHKIRRAWFRIAFEHGFGATKKCRLVKRLYPNRYEQKLLPALSDSDTASLYVPAN